MTGDERVLVTGGSGFIAGHCIAQALAQGYQVRTTVRNPAREGELRTAVRRLVDPADRLEVVPADLEADTGWRTAASDCTFVLHVASPFPRANPRDDAELVRPARDGALRVLTAARDAGVKRVVMTSSTAAVATGGADAPNRSLRLTGRTRQTTPTPPPTNAPRRSPSGRHGIGRHGKAETSSSSRSAREPCSDRFSGPSTPRPSTSSPGSWTVPSPLWCASAGRSSTYETSLICTYAP